MVTTSNPLAKHFRQPAIYLKLPSGGRFWPADSLDLPPNNEIPVYPMTVKDELLLQTPDALINGSSVVEMIRSCCPNIIDPWVIPSTDLDSILIAIRIASYGAQMDFGTECPHCKVKNDHAVDLRVLLDNVRPAAYNNTHELAGLTFKFRPQTYKELNLISQASFEQRKLVSTISDSNLEDTQKAEMFKEGFARLTQLNIDTIISSIASITVDDQTVTDHDQIQEFLVNVDRNTYEEIKLTISNIAQEHTIAPVELTCNDCSQPYVSELEFNQSNFFG